MGNRPLALQALFNLEDEIRQEYLTTVKTQNPDRIQLLDKVKALIEAIRHAEGLSEAEAQDLCMGAYVLAYESIREEYNYLDPEFKKGYLWDSGSVLFHILKKKLGITAENPLNQNDRLIYLSRLFRFMHDEKYEAGVNRTLEAHNRDVVDMRVRVGAAIKAVFKLNKDDVNKVLHAIPAETKLDEHMQNIVETYLRDTSASNEDRKFHANLIKALSGVIPFDPNAADHKHFLSRNQRVKMGYLLYVMQLIWDSYYIRSPKGNSVLYDLILESLNISSLKDIDPQTRLACLTAFETFVTDSKNVAKLEGSLDKVYVDPAIHVIKKKLDVMIEANHVSIPVSHGVSSFAISTAALGAIIASAPGYGTGYVIGYTASQINEMVPFKLAVSKVTNYSLSLILGGAGNYLGYYASNMVVDATLERAFAKIFEALGMLAGAATGGILGLVIYDLSYQTLKNLSSLVFHLHDKLPSELAKDIDPKYIQCLLELPNDIFPNEMKVKVSAVTNLNHVGMFRPPVLVAPQPPAAVEQQEDRQGLVRSNNG